MDSYQEIAILPDAEFAPTVLMNALFGKLHRALAGLRCREIGVSFPEYDSTKPTLGKKLRVHGSIKSLELLASTRWLNGFLDHVGVTGPWDVPDNVGQVLVRRVQAKSNADRLRRRMARRHGITEEEAMLFITDKAEERLDLPFVTLHSSSTDREFRLFIEQGERLSTPAPGEFSQYGLSSRATVPWF